MFVGTSTYLPNCEGLLRGGKEQADTGLGLDYINRISPAGLSLLYMCNDLGVNMDVEVTANYSSFGCT